MALNQLKFDQLETGSVYPITASYALNSSGGGGGTTLTTGSTYPITASWSNNATTASFASNSTSASYSNTASVALNSLTASYLNPISQSLIPSTGSIYSLGSPTNKWKDLYVSTGSIYIGETVLSTSGSTLFANSSPIVTLNTASGQIEVAGLTASLSASFASNAILLNNTASTVFATTGSNTFSGSQIVHGNITVNGSLFGTASVALVALTSSYNLNSVSSSYSLTASYAMNGGSGGGTTLTTGSSYPITSSWAINVVSASYALIAESATTANSSTSASYALTASFALNSIAGASGSEGGGLFVVTSDGFNYNIAGYSGTFPTITLVRGQLYYFNISGVSASHPFALRLSSGNTSAVPGTTNNDPVSGNANTSTLIIYRVPNDAPNSIVYQCTVHSSMIGTINIVNQYGTTLTTGSTYPITSSWSNNATTATSATSATSANSATSASYSLTSSYNLNSISSSFASTASYNLNSISSSYALTASYAMNGGSGGGTTLTTGSSYPITSSWSNNALTASYAINAVSIITASLQTGSIASQTILYNVTTSQDNIISGLNLTGNKWGVSVIEEWNSGSIVGDEYYNSCSLLLHFSGSNDSTVFIDDSPRTKTVTAIGNAKISTAQSKFGSSSAYFDGNLDGVTTPSNADFLFGTGNFTIEGWIYLTAATGDYRTIFSFSNAGVRFGNSAAYNSLLQVYLDGSTAATVWNVNKNQTQFLNSWNHIAFTREGTTCRVFVNGIQENVQNGTNASSFPYASFSDSTNVINSSAPTIGYGGINSPITDFVGYIDEVRVTKGIARYTGSFSAPTSEFPATITQYETKYIGLIGGLNDSTVDYGVEKLSDSSLKIRKMTASGQPLSGSGSTLSASVDRVYVNVLNYDNVSVLPTASYALTASYAMNGGSGGSGGAFQTGSIAGQTILYNVTTSQDNVITGLNLSSNKWGVSVIEEWNNVSGDIYYPSCSLLLHFSGSNGSTTFTDNSPRTKTATSNNGAVISTAQSKFGGTSGFFDGTNDYVSIPNNAEFNFASGTFTVELWAYFSSVSDQRVLVTNYQDATNGWVLQLLNGIVNVNLSGNGQDIIGTTTILTNTWYHITVSGTAGAYKLFLNGVQEGSTYTGGTTLTSTSALTIGQIISSGYFIGYIDELRITNGVARYTASFATQSIEFPNQLPQYETKYVGLVGGINDSTVDYGIEKLSDSSLKIRKMTATGQPLSGSGSTLSASVDRVYVNVLDYTNVMVTSSYALTASYVLGGIQTGSISNQTILYNVTTSQENTITGLDLSGNKWDVSVIEEWNSASIVGGDTYYSSCSLLMHFSGSDGSTTFIDNSPVTKSFTVNGNSQISTAQSKFGGTSAYFDGTGDYLSTNSSNNFAFGTGDFTVEFWIYSSDVSSATQRGFLQTSDTAGGLKTTYTSGILLYQGGNSSGGTLNGGLSANVAGTNLGSSTAVITTNTWYHIALVRNSGTSTLYVNGTSVGSGTTTGNCSGTYLSIGGYYNTSYLYQGYLDELRITKGVARYTTNFTPQTSEFENYGNLNQLITKYIGLVGGINDSTVDYGVEKLSDTSLKIRKMTASGQPLSGSGALSASVDRVYVNVLNYKEVQTTAQSASYAVSSSYVINAPSGESFHPFLLG
jgi:hypothetical protein